MAIELKLSTGRVVTWDGESGEDAARRYVDMHREATVVAWRHVRHGLFVGAQRIVEPDPGFGPGANERPARG